MTGARIIARFVRPSFAYLLGSARHHLADACFAAAGSRSRQVSPHRSQQPELGARRHSTGARRTPAAATPCLPGLTWNYRTRSKVRGRRRRILLVSNTKSKTRASSPALLLVGAEEAEDGLATPCYPPSSATISAARSEMSASRPQTSGSAPSNRRRCLERPGCCRTPHLRPRRVPPRAAGRRVGRGRALRGAFLGREASLFGRPSSPFSMSGPGALVRQSSARAYSSPVGASQPCGCKVPEHTAAGALYSPTLAAIFCTDDGRRRARRARWCPPLDDGLRLRRTDR